MTHVNGHTINASASFPLRTLAVIGTLILLASASASAQLPGRCELPVSERTGDIGCYVLKIQPLGPLPDTQLFWHLYVFPSREAAKAASAPRQMSFSPNGV